MSTVPAGKKLVVQRYSRRFLPELSFDSSIHPCHSRNFIPLFKFVMTMPSLHKKHLKLDRSGMGWYLEKLQTVWCMVKKSLLRRILLSFACTVSLPFFLCAQSPNTQLWFEYMLNSPFANSFNIENAFVYSTLLDSPRWRAFDYSPTLEYSITQNIDLSVGVTLSFTDQTEEDNTFEIRPVLGSRIHITPNKRILTRLFVRVEQRNFKNLDTGEWDAVIRPRARAEVLIPINRKTYFEDKLWYGILDAEWFFETEGVDERFANRFRLRMGVGYRLSYSSRFEFIYMNQESKNGIDDTFYSSDNILRFRYKHYLRKNKPTTMSGTGI